MWRSPLGCRPESTRGGSPVDSLIAPKGATTTPHPLPLRSPRPVARVTRGAGSTYGVQVSAARVGLDGLAADFVEHRSLVGDSNAVVARELVLLESLLCGPQANAPIVERLGKAWRSRTFRAYYERPLLLAAALRLEAMQEGSP